MAESGYKLTASEIPADVRAVLPKQARLTLDEGCAIGDVIREHKPSTYPALADRMGVKPTALADMIGGRGSRATAVLAGEIIGGAARAEIARILAGSIDLITFEDAAGVKWRLIRDDDSVELI